MPITPRAAVFLGGFVALVAGSVIAARAGEPALPFLVMPAVVTLSLLYVEDRWPAWRRERERRAKGHCRRCGYDLTGNVSRVCPECGNPT